MVQQTSSLCVRYIWSRHLTKYTSVMIHHRGANLSEQHNDLLCTKQDLSHTSRYVHESSPDSQVSHTYARTVASYPGSCVGREKRAWYRPFAHALNYKLKNHVYVANDV